MIDFAKGDRVTKRSGSSWTGRVVGYYTTDLTPDGICVESENEPGSVQIYPAKALVAVEADRRARTFSPTEIDQAVEAELADAATFLLDRLDEAERDMADDDFGREYSGHVVPAAARLRMAIAKTMDEPESCMSIWDVEQPANMTMQSDALIEEMARATCKTGGLDPDFMMANDGPRWKYYVPLVAVLIPIIEREKAAAIAGLGVDGEVG